jgi:Bacterial Ig-like domain (group 3)
MLQLSYKRPARTQPPRLLRAAQIVLAVLLALCTGALVSPASTFAAALTSTRLASTNNSSKYGEPVTFIAAVFWGNSAGAPTGTVMFTDGTIVLGNISLDSNWRAAVTTSSLAAGSHSIAATYVPADALVLWQ